MNDTLISFETAKLAKEKGFNWDTNRCFNDNSILEKFDEYDATCSNHNELDLFTSAPTQSLLQKWLREVHKINTESNYLPNVSKYRCLYKPMNIKNSDFKTVKEYYNTVDKYYGKINYDTYEEALEIGLQEALKLL